MNEREALKLALEALEGVEALLSSMGLTHLIIYGDAEKAITNLSQALAEQEPVAWGHPNSSITGRKQALMMVNLEIPSNAQYPELWVPLYTTPPQRKPWVGLTEQEHTDIAIQSGCMSADWVLYGATVERILKEKNS